MIQYQNWTTHPFLKMCCNEESEVTSLSLSYCAPAFLTGMNLPFFPCTGFLLPIEHGGLSFAACWSGLRAGQAGLQCPWGGSLGEADSDTTRFTCPNTVMGFPNGSDRKESACNGGDPGSIPVWGRSTREGNGNPLQYSCLEMWPHPRGSSRISS